jgi:hypothetical protein
MDLCPNVKKKNVRRRGATASGASDPLDTDRRLDTYIPLIAPCHVPTALSFGAKDWRQV